MSYKGCNRIVEIYDILIMDNMKNEITLNL